MPLANPGENRGGVGDPVGPDQWFRSLPIVTQVWFGATVVVTLSVNFKVITAYQIFWSWEHIKSSFELWRVLTPFCYAGPFAFPTLISIYMLESFSKQYEVGGPFNTGAGGGTADYAFCMLFGAISMLCSYPLLFGMFGLPPFFCRNMIYYVVYIWSKRNPTAQANIWGFPIAGVYLPFAYLALTVLIGDSYMDMLHGISMGHIYYFLVDVVPMVYGKDILKTPQFMIDYFGVGQFQPQNQPARPPAAGGFGGGAVGGGNAGAAAAPAARGGGGHQWGGGGRALGRQ